MAKWGEGDPRWIVEERPDAVNVNNWHWTEKNATPWSNQRLKELLSGHRFEKGPFVVEFGEMNKLEGEATANNRKSKLIFLYEWEIEVKFIVKIAGTDMEYKGNIEIPNLSDENEADEVDVNLNLNTNGPHEADIRNLFKQDVTRFVRDQLAVYIRELKEEFSKGLILPTDRTKPQIVCRGKSTGVQSVDKKSFQNHVVTAAGEAMNSVPVTFTEVKSIKVTETFKVQPDRLWDVLTNPELVKKWSNSAVEMNVSNGGTFSLYNGMVHGVFVTLDPCIKMEMRWRMKSYPQNHFAKITLYLKDNGDSTDLEILGDDVPISYSDETENGLKRFYIQNISKTFGFGARIS